MENTHKIALVGIGKIAQDQHVPAISASPSFVLSATASRNAQIGGIDGYGSLEELLNAQPDITCISLCTPPQARYADARRALLAGRHVMLEKPPGATLSEVHALHELARAQGVSLYATWHSRHADCVERARDWLADKTIQKLEIVWKEDVRRWHPGQEWIWNAGGLGVFDPGINALSILTAIYPGPLHLSRAELSFPANRDTPIAADLEFFSPDGADVTAQFDWRHEGHQTWDIRVTTDQGEAVLSEGGSKWTIDGVEQHSGADREYSKLYARFAQLVASSATDVDVSPMRHVADAFTLGKRRAVDPFDW